MPTDRLTVLGAGGHAKVVCDAILRAGLAISVAVRDDNAALAGSRVLGLEVCVPIGPLEAVSHHVHVAIGDNGARRALALQAQAAGRQLVAVVHPHAGVSQHARIGAGVFVAAHALLAPDAQIGECAIINHGAVVDHDCRVGAWTHVAPNATVGGAVMVGEGCLIGAGAVVLPGLRIGDWAVIGAGAVVTRSVQEGQKVMGVPAREVSRV
jgi:sugar O-acyltransferase (sialic acid O-acetyltransferase NeuD family)